ncbi:MAG: DNA-binding protein [Phycisphaerae bacterium]|jgi:hypothetical protein
MKKAVIMFVVSLILSCGADCFAQQISSTGLINNAREYDGNSVIYVGEAVGDVMVRGDFAWVNVNDGENAIGVWMNKDLAGEIRLTGSYRAKGDRLEITGVFNRNCVQHGGDMDIHAQSMRRINPGRFTGEELDKTKRNYVFILLAALCLTFVFVRRRKS